LAPLFLGFITQQAHMFKNMGITVYICRKWRSRVGSKPLAHVKPVETLFLPRAFLQPFWLARSMP